MTSQEETTAQKNKKNEPRFKEAGGVYGWLLKKAKTFMWDAASNTLTLPKGVVLTKEEKEALEEVIGAVKEEAAEVAKRRQMHMAAAQKAGVKFKADVVKGYTVLFSGSYRELTGILAQKVHENLQGMLQVNNRFLSGVWKVISGAPGVQKEEKNSALVMSRGRDGR